MLVPKRPRATIEDTVTVSVADLYDFINRHKEEPMPDLNAATSVKKVKRGWRRLSMSLRVHEYDLLSKMAEEESRSPDQQAAYLLRQKLNEMVEAPLGNGSLGDLGEAEMEEVMIEDAARGV